MIDGRVLALELLTRFECNARPKGTPEDSASLCERARDEASVEGDWPGVPGLNRLRAFSAPESESSSESLSSDVSRSSIALWIVDCSRSKKSAGDAGAGAE